MADKTKYERLYELLDEAKTLSGSFSGGYSNNFLSAQEFHNALVESVERLKQGDKDQLNKLWLWFSPTCDWDDLIGRDGHDLAEQIFPIVHNLKKLQGIYSIVDLIIDY